MVGPSSRISKILLALLFLVILFYIAMDFALYFRIQNYPIERNYHLSENSSSSVVVVVAVAENLPPASAVSGGSTQQPAVAVVASAPYGQDAWVPCNINPLCHVTVKALLLDHTNHYIFAPLATIFDNVLGFSRSSFITANMISFFHVGVACVAGKLISSDNLGYRRLGVVSFQLRTFLDDLDGHVARVKKNIRGERSEVGTSGYYIDGICDGIGCIALLIGIFFYLKNNPPRRGYVQLLPISETKFAEPTNKPKLKYTTRKIAKKVVSFTGQLLLSSTAWNRYIAVYQEMLERNDDVSAEQLAQQNLVFKSTWFFCVAWLWRILNVHALLHYVLLSIFCDKLWDFLKAIQYSGYLALLVIICVTEMHALEAHNQIFNAYLYETGWHLKGLIGVSEPRNAAVEANATQVAFECGEQVGATCGYATDYAEELSHATSIKFMSESVFVRELLADPLLTKYAVVIVDEAHERNVTTDIILTLLKKICRQRRSCLKIIILLSAATDIRAFRDFYEEKRQQPDDGTTTTTSPRTVVLSVTGAVQPVKVHYLEQPCSDYVSETVATIMAIHKKEAGGHIMAFLTSHDEILEAFKRLKEHVAAEELKNLHIFPLYGALSVGEQSRVFQRLPKGRRKVVLVTNVAETTLKIPGINYVVDCGYVKIRWFEARSLSYSLLIVPISRAVAAQRAGRAGLDWPGKVFRLYTEAEHAAFVEHIPPEMRRGDLTDVVLLLKALGIGNIMQFEFLSPPPVKNLKMVLEMLYAIEAIDEQCNLTKPLGYMLAEMPCSPLLSRMLHASGRLRCTEEAITIVAMLQVQPIFAKSTNAPQSDGAVAKRHFEAAEGDLVTLLNVYNAYVANGQSREFCGRFHLVYRSLQRVVAVRAQLVRLAKRRLGLASSTCHGDVEVVCKCITAGFFLNAAHLHYSGEYRKINSGERLRISPTSSLHGCVPQPQYVIYASVLKTTERMMQDLTVIKEDWLKETAPHYYC